MENHLKRVLNLVRKTGDTMVVVDKDGQESFVVMDLDQYEMLLDGSLGFDEDWDDIAPESDEEFSSESDMEEEETAPVTSGQDIWDVMPEAGADAQTWDIDRLSEGEMADLERQYKEFAGQHVKEAVEDTHKPLEKPTDDEYGEEQFYLEPIE